ncbi:hypothetical protein QAD02_005452 [Eretmocerus hayati]|uniref:Uncharacterized protein n=1 Tax=Eretmocerus hayati TaxID=131215 RepID=A0ACC2NXB9_9HYME|nr:hypothetical protein QAD02_005452 [Eretmocerus hayati]
MYSSAFNSNQNQYRDPTLRFQNGRRHDPRFTSYFGTQQGPQLHGSESNRFPISQKREFVRQVSNGQSKNVDLIQGRISPDHYASLQALAAPEIDLGELQPDREFHHPHPNGYHRYGQQTVKDRLGGFETTNNRRQEILSSMKPQFDMNHRPNVFRAPSPHEVQSRTYLIDDGRPIEIWNRNVELKQDWRSENHRPLLQIQDISTLGQVDSRALLGHHETQSDGYNRAHETKELLDRFHGLESNREMRPQNYRPLMQMRPFSPPRHAIETFLPCGHIESQSDDFSILEVRPSEARYCESDFDQERQSTSDHSRFQSQDFHLVRDDLLATPCYNDQSERFTFGDERAVEQLQNSDLEYEQDLRSMDGYSDVECLSHNEQDLRNGLEARRQVRGRLQQSKQSSHLNNLPNGRIAVLPVFSSAYGINTQVKLPIVLNGSRVEKMQRNRSYVPIRSPNDGKVRAFIDPAKLKKKQKLNPRRRLRRATARKLSESNKPMQVIARYQAHNQPKKTPAVPNINQNKEKKVNSRLLHNRKRSEEYKEKRRRARMEARAQLRNASEKTGSNA